MLAADSARSHVGRLDPAHLVSRAHHLRRTTAADRLEARFDAPHDARQPPNKAARCQYAKDWIAVKRDRQLTITTTERDALSRMTPATDHCSRRQLYRVGIRSATAIHCGSSEHQTAIVEHC
jgi:hypothetical protein